MTASRPQIGFDRFIDLAWATTALRVRAGVASADEYEEMLVATGLTVAALKKTRTVLNRIWNDPLPNLVGLANAAAAIYRAHPNMNVSVLCWGMAIAAYPFFGKVAELIGRLSALQGDCSSAEVHRRMSEVYGERAGTSRMTNMVIQSQASWGAIQRTDGGKRIVRLAATPIENEEIIAWLIEAAVRYVGRPVPIVRLPSLPVLFPFTLKHSLAFVASRAPSLSVRSDGSGDQLVALST